MSIERPNVTSTKAGGIKEAEPLLTHSTKIADLLNQNLTNPEVANAFGTLQEAVLKAQPKISPEAKETGFEYPKTMSVISDALETFLASQDLTKEERLFGEKFKAKFEKQTEEAQTVEYDRYVNQEMSKAFLEMMQSGDILTEQRSILDVNVNNEKPFNVKVLDLEENLNDEQSAWQTITGAPSMFVHRGKDSKGQKAIPTIFISKTLFEKLSDPRINEPDTDEYYDYQHLRKIIQHEYRHTQRKFASENDQLFRLIDEACTNVGTFYIELRVLLDCLGMTTHLFNMSTIKASYEKDSDEDKARVLKEIQASFGTLGLLLIGAKKSSAHTGDSDGLDSLPLTEYQNQYTEDEYSNSELANSMFLEKLLSLRSKVEPNWQETFKINLENEELYYLESIVKNYALTSYQKLVNHSNCPNLNLFFETLEEVIETKRLLA